MEKTKTQSPIKKIFLSLIMLFALAVLTYATIDSVNILAPGSDYWNQTGDLKVRITYTANPNSTNLTANCTIHETATYANGTFFGNASSSAIASNGTAIELNLTGINTSRGDGHLYFVRCVNVSNTKDSAPRYAKIDRENPTVVRTNPFSALNAHNQSNVTIKVTADVAELNPDYCQLEINSTVYSKSLFLNGSVVFNPVDQGEGRYLIDVRCFDKSGRNTTNATSANNYTVQIDTQVPALILQAPATLIANTTLKAVNFSVLVSDRLPHKCELSINQSAGANNTLVVNQTDNVIVNGTTTNFTAINLADGNRVNWSIRCNDILNQTTTINGTLSIDNTLPGDLLYSSPVNNTYTADLSPEVVWYSAPDSNIDRYEVSVFYPNSTLFNKQNISNSSRNAANLSLPDAYTRMIWNVTAIDLAGNRNGSSNGTLSITPFGSCLTLYKGWNYCAMTHNTTINLSDLTLEISPYADQLSKLNSSKALETFVRGVSANGGVTVIRSDILLVHVTQNTSWNSQKRTFATDTGVNNTNVTLTNTTTSWNYLAIENRSDYGVTFQQIEDAINGGTNGFSDLVVPSIAYINGTRIYSYVLGSGDPWNTTKVYYGDFLYLGVDNLNSSTVVNRSAF